jgi:hypothetical protein
MILGPKAEPFCQRQATLATRSRPKTLTLPLLLLFPRPHMASGWRMTLSDSIALLVAESVLQDFAAWATNYKSDSGTLNLR